MALDYVIALGIPGGGEAKFKFGDSKFPRRAFYFPRAERAPHCSLSVRGVQVRGAAAFLISRNAFDR